VLEDLQDQSEIADRHELVNSHSVTNPGKGNPKNKAHKVILIGTAMPGNVHIKYQTTLEILM